MSVPKDDHLPLDIGRKGAIWALGIVLEKVQQDLLYAMSKIHDIVVKQVQILTDCHHCCIGVSMNVCDDGFQEEGT